MGTGFKFEGIDYGILYRKTEDGEYEPVLVIDYTVSVESAIPEFKDPRRIF